MMVCTFIEKFKSFFIYVLGQNLYQELTNSVFRYQVVYKNEYNMIDMKFILLFVTRVWLSSLAWPIQSVFTEFPEVLAHLHTAKVY